MIYRINRPVILINCLIMKTELQQYAASFEAELVAFRDLSTSEFVSKVIGEK
ncbi:hypothetical protein GCM10011369_30990 [Neiella marina]|uniref:Uncharacterized protein n=1 Tax=Neiella marina TaxID=508461 RepID=A0A8J2U8Q3_9GAMM|nr:hypothetical protein GCM10011369_30990 [Neiella marina]